MPSEQEWKDTLPEQLLAAIDKPNNGLLIVELSPNENRELNKWIKTLTFGQLMNTSEVAFDAILKLMKATNTKTEVTDT